MNLKQLRRFLGVGGWYTRFLPSFSKDKVSLCHLLKKDVHWHWNQEQQLAFEKIKEVLMRAPVLLRPNFAERFYLHCDSSDYAIGCVLTVTQLCSSIAFSLL